MENIALFLMKLLFLILRKNHKKIEEIIKNERDYLID